MFRVPNYESHPDGSRTPDENGRVACHCGRMVWPFVLVPVHSMDVPHDWACDACWTTWQRDRKPLKAGNKPNGRKGWDEQWLQLHGAPQDAIDKMKQTNRRG